MPRAKAAYDENGLWKIRQFDHDQWERLTGRLRKRLRPFYPDKGAVPVPPFGHPADEWANVILAEASAAVEMTRWLMLRRTNEELRVEFDDLMSRLSSAADALSNMSLDVQNLLPVDVEPLTVRDAIQEMLPKFQAARARVANLRRAPKIAEVMQAAALEMSIRVLRIAKDYGLSIAATAHTELGYISDAVQILKIVGDELGVCLDEKSWKRQIARARDHAPDLRALNTPQ